MPSPATSPNGLQSTWQQRGLGRKQQNAQKPGPTSRLTAKPGMSCTRLPGPAIRRKRQNQRTSPTLPRNLSCSRRQGTSESSPSEQNSKTSKPTRAPVGSKSKWPTKKLQFATLSATNQ